MCSHPDTSRPRELIVRLQEARKAMATDVKAETLTGVEEQIRDLLPGLEKQVEIAAVLAELQRLANLVAGLPTDPMTSQTLPPTIQEIKDIQAGKEGLPGMGTVLANLYAIQQSLNVAM